jgi:hypothetical protein
MGGTLYDKGAARVHRARDAVRRRASVAKERPPPGRDIVATVIRFLAVVLLLSAGCAKGSSGDEGDRVPVDLSGRDGGGGGRDLGDDERDMLVEMCDDDSYPDECASAEDLGELLPGAEAVVVNGFLPLLGDEDWFAVRFPPNMSGPGGGAPTIELTGDDTTVMTIEGPTCGPRAHCGEGSAGAINSYSFTDDADDSVEFPYSTRDVEWPESLFIRVHRSGGPVTCTEYAVTITR